MCSCLPFDEGDCVHSVGSLVLISHNYLNGRVWIENDMRKMTKEYSDSQIEKETFNGMSKKEKDKQ